MPAITEVKISPPHQTETNSLSTEARRLVNLAKEYALNSSQTHVGTVHLTYALVTHSDDVRNMVRKRNVDPEKIIGSLEPFLGRVRKSRRKKAEDINPGIKLSEILSTRFVNNPQRRLTPLDLFMIISSTRCLGGDILRDLNIFPWSEEVNTSGIERKKGLFRIWDEGV